MRPKRNGNGVQESYSRYVLERKYAKPLLRECRTGKHADLVRQAAHQVAPHIEKWLAQSIIEGKSFDRMAVKWELGEAEMMPCCRNGFYKYRRLTLAMVDRMLQESGML